MIKMDMIEEFGKTVDAIYGAYLDAIEGFSLLKEHLENGQHYQIMINKKLKEENTNPNIHYNVSSDDFDSSCIIYSEGEEGTNDYKILHYCCTQAEFIERNSPSGRNYRFIGNMSLISIYQYWEDYFRSKIATYLFNKQKDELQSPIIGDLKLLRHSIIHHNGIALKNVEKCEILKWHKEGDEIFINKYKFEEIISQVYLWIKELKMMKNVASPELRSGAKGGGSDSDRNPSRR